MQRRILVIDDEVRLAESLAALLREEGYQAEAAGGGQAGLARLADCRYEVVITDLRMPGVDGFAVMDEIARRCPDTAVIVITGHASTQSAIEAIHNRVADYITKPFELETLLGSLAKVFARLETEELRRDMIRMVSHDIKAPLNIILGFAEFITDRKTGEASRNAPEYAEKIIQSTQKIIGLLDNYLTHARAESGRLEVLPRDFDARGPLREAAGLFRSEFDRRRLDFQLEMPDEPIPMTGDEHLLYRALANLLSNAAKYAPEATWARASVAREGGDVVYRVDNFGSRLAPDEIDLVFEKYGRSRSARGIEGSGLGLYVVQSVARAHGGRATAECVEGERTTFRIAVPAAGPPPKDEPAELRAGGPAVG